MPDPKKEDLSPWAAYGLAAEIGYLIAVPVVLLGVGGAYLDKYAGTSPVFLFIGFILSFVVSARGVWKVVKRLEERTDRTSKVK